MYLICFSYAGTICEGKEIMRIVEDEKHGNHFI